MDIFIGRLFSVSPAASHSEGNLAGELYAMFRLAARISSRPKPLTDIDKQHALNQIFLPLLAKGITLTEQHYSETLEVWQLDTVSARERAELFLALAAIFTHYSSSRHFGEEDDSPQVLRNYAFAHMAKARELMPDLFNLRREDFDDWTNRLLGKEGAFTCTAVLFEMMKEHMNSNVPGCLQYLPPAWGGDARIGDSRYAIAERLSPVQILSVDPVEIN